MEIIGNHRQVAEHFEAPVTVVPPPHSAQPEIVRRMPAAGALRYAVQMSGRDDYEIADLIGISHGYMCKVLKGTAGLHGKRLVKFMQITNSVAPLQWLAEQMGCTVEVVDRKLLELAAARNRVAELEGRLGR